MVGVLLLLVRLLDVRLLDIRLGLAVLLRMAEPLVAVRLLGLLGLLRRAVTTPVPLLLLFPAHQLAPAGVPTSPVRLSFCQRSRPPVRAVMLEWMRTRYIIWR